MTGQTHVRNADTSWPATRRSTTQALHQNPDCLDRSRREPLSANGPPRPLPHGSRPRIRHAAIVDATATPRTITATPEPSRTRPTCSAARVRLMAGLNLACFTGRPYCSDPALISDGDVQLWPASMLQPTDCRACATLRWPTSRRHITQHAEPSPRRSLTRVRRGAV